MKQIVVMFNEAWTSLDDAQIWTISDEGYETLNKTFKVPKDLTEKDIIKIETCSDFVNDIADEVGSLEQHLTEDKSSESDKKSQYEEVCDMGGCNNILAINEHIHIWEADVIDENTITKELTICDNCHHEYYVNLKEDGYSHDEEDISEEAVQ